MRIGVLALQGDFALHRQALDRIGVESAEVRKPSGLQAVDGLIIPGGESTTLLKLMEACEFGRALAEFHSEGKLIFGTCAGLIVLAREVLNPTQSSLGLIDVTTERNAYGRQKESFETSGEATLDGGRDRLKMVFIRAPRIRRVGPTVTPLAFHEGECVLAREGSVVVATFHPELTDDATVHRYVCRMVGESGR
ncbi:MAG: pyridoxal 5'-phosphate synthase glutaminase subunit PdxT [Candidatus Methylomirabilia bacterium]